MSQRKTFCNEYLCCNKMAISLDIYWQKVIILISLSCLINYADSISDLSHLSNSNYSSTVITFGSGESFESNRKDAQLRAHGFSQIFNDASKLGVIRNFVKFMRGGQYFARAKPSIFRFTENTSFF